MSVLIEFSVAPLDQGESVATHVAKCISIIESSGLAFRLNPMGTVIESEDLRAGMAVVEKCMERVSEVSNRVSCSVKIDWRRGSMGRIKSKTEAVERILGKKLAQ